MNNTGSVIAAAALLVALSSVVHADELTGSKPADVGATKADTQWKIGDKYTYRSMDLFSRVESGHPVFTVTGVTDTQVIYGNGRRITDLLGNDIKIPDGGQYSGMQIYVPEYSVGKKWTTRFRSMRPNGNVYTVVVDFEVAAKETITVPAGTFDTYRVEGRGDVSLLFGYDEYPTNYVSNYKIWIAPGKVRRCIAYDYSLKIVITPGYYVAASRVELVSYQQAD